MKTLRCLLLGLLLTAAGASLAGSTVDPAHPYVYGLNTGWMNARADGTNGAVIGQAYCTGYVWSANCGWICLGNGPANGWQYSNSATNDWGVNHDGQGRLTGFAYGSSIGWLTFEQTQGQPRVDLRTGELSGYIWGANCGWISLANAQAYVRTVRLDAGPDTVGDGIPDWWRSLHFGGSGTTTNAQSAATADPDGDHLSNLQEYLAGTDPLNPADRLQIVTLAVTGTTHTVRWTATPTRLYQLEATNRLSGASGAWSDAGPGIMGPLGASPAEAVLTGVVQTSRFYRVRALVPLAE